MGHSNASMIMNIYAKLTAEKEQEDAMSLNDYFNMAKKQPENVIKMDFRYAK